ncbi:Splicing factor U2AF 26 kDa subunit, partial [Blyttiomyces sp. JEL0837]
MADHLASIYGTEKELADMEIDVPENILNEEQLQEHFDLFYEDMFMELGKYGEIEDLNVCDNVGDHLVGNVYVMYKYEEDAGKAVESLNQRFYAGRPLYAELSPVTDFGEACCRQTTRGSKTVFEDDAKGRERDRSRDRRGRDDRRDRESSRRDRDREGGERKRRSRPDDYMPFPDDEERM